MRLPKLLASELRAYLGGRLDQPDAFVFTGPHGGPLRHHWFYRRHFKPAVKRAGLPAEVRFHDLRHTCASLLIAKGASVKAVQKQLGHRSAVVTLDTYGHLFPDEMDRLAAAMDVTYHTARNRAARSARPGKAA